MRYRGRGSQTNPIFIIITANFLVYVATIIAPELVLVLGLLPASFLSQPWTMVTNLFVHAGFWHLFTNMLTLYFFGTYLRQLVGEKRFLIVYLVGGFLGNTLYIVLTTLGFIFSVGFLGSPFNLAVGASGAVFALGGALTMMRPKLKVFVFPIPAPIPLWAAVIGGFFVLSLLPLVAWQAHLGGLVLGLIAGYFFRKRERRFFQG